MSQESDTFTSLGWSDVWASVLTQPSVATFETILGDPQATDRRACTWVFMSALIGYTFSMFVQALVSGLNGSASQAGSSIASAVGISLIAMLCAAPFSALGAVLGLVTSAGITQLIANALGGTGTYSKLVYAFAAYIAPLTLLTSLLGAIPLVNCLAVLPGIYGLVLNVIAVKAVNQFGWGRAIASSVFILLVALVLVAIIWIVVLALLGPSIRDMFYNFRGTPPELP